MSGISHEKHHTFDPVWHVQLAMVFAFSLQLLLPDKFSVGIHSFLLFVEALLIVSLGLTTPQAKVYESFKRRINVVALIAITTFANIYSLFVVARHLLQPGSIDDGRALILAAINIFVTNVIIFALWYWEMDGGGPGARQRIMKHDQDFVFTQHRNELYRHPKWLPTFIDYLYISATNAMSFSPGDALPLSRRAKMLMMLQAVTSLITIFLVAARAVGVLS